MATSRGWKPIYNGLSSLRVECPLWAEWGQRIHVGRREEVWVFGAMEPIARGVLNPISPR